LLSVPGVIAPAPDRYGSTAVAFHWIVATLIVFSAPLGFSSTKSRVRRSDLRHLRLGLARACL
jgi:hypothetical protein